MGHLSNKKGLITGFRLVVGDLGKGSRKGFCCGWTLPGSRGNYVAGCLNTSHLEGGRDKARLQV